MGCFVIACGLAQTGLSLVIFRAMQGIAYAMVVPSAVSIISTSVTEGRPRNIGFSCLGMSSTMGFALGLVLSGVFVDSVGWRMGFYIGGGLSFLFFVVGLWALPTTTVRVPVSEVLSKVRCDIDWIGALLASTAITLFSYVLACVQKATFTGLMLTLQQHALCKHRQHR